MLENWEVNCEGEGAQESKSMQVWMNSFGHLCVEHTWISS